MTPNELVLTFRGSYVCANYCENRSRNATVRVLADGQTHRQTDRQTDTHTQTQTDFIICPMLYAIAMGQIIITVSYCVEIRPFIYGVVQKSGAKCIFLLVSFKRLDQI